MSTERGVRRNRVRYSAPALEKGLDVLELLAAEPHSLSLQEIAQRLERTPNEIYRMLDVLVRRGYLARRPDATYVLTLRLFELAHRHPPMDRLLDVAMPYMQALARLTGQSNHLCVHHDARLVVLARAEPPEPISASFRQGAHFPFRDDRVSPRVISAFQGPDRREAYLDELLRDERPSAARRRKLAARLEQIRARGYDEGPSDTVEGVSDICFPIFDHFGVVAALNIVYLQHRDVRVGIPAARAQLRQIAESISRSLGWLPPPHNAAARSAESSGAI
ncbi:MAG TPA: IclR family transcriptional regulator [Burkholderiales bacterium]|nr:IclR family transcriptional regulator [Burkholderiales bacterium]